MYEDEGQKLQIGFSIEDKASKGKDDRQIKTSARMGEGEGFNGGHGSRNSRRSL